MADRVKLRAAIARLPLLPGIDIESAVETLAVGCYFSQVNELPRMTDSRRKNGAVQELRRFQRLAMRLHEHLNSMHRDALNALASKDERHALTLDCDLERMIAKAETYVASAPARDASTSPKRLAPEQVAQFCAQEYVSLTGRTARLHWDDIAEKRGGPYMTFLQDVFGACGIKASAEHYGKEAHRAETIGGNGGVTMRRVPKKSG